MEYYKITNEAECHHGLQYHDGPVADSRPFMPIGSCVPGGIYFAREDILAFISYGPWIRTVTLPDDARWVEDPDKNIKKWRADRVILGPRRRVEAEVVRVLLAEGADANAGQDEALRGAAGAGYVDVVRVLLAVGADVHAREDEALRGAAGAGYVDVVRVLLAAGADVHAREDEALRRAAKYGHVEVIRVLLEYGADVFAKEEEAMVAAARGRHVKVLRLLHNERTLRKSGKK